MPKTKAEKKETFEKCLDEIKFYIKRIAGKMSIQYGLDYDDLYQEFCILAWKSWKAWKIEKGKFSTYAIGMLLCRRKNILRNLQRRAQKAPVDYSDSMDSFSRDDKTDMNFLAKEIDRYAVQILPESALKLFKFICAGGSYSTYKGEKNRYYAEKVYRQEIAPFFESVKNLLQI